MSCSSSCKRPTPSQAHCGACHVTFGGVRAFDVHRGIPGQCVTPASLGMKINGHGVWTWPLSDEQRQRLEDLRQTS